MVDMGMPAGVSVPLRILFLGLPGVMAEVVLETLLAWESKVAAVVMPVASIPQLVTTPRLALTPVEPPPQELLVAGPEPVRSLPAIAWEANVPLYAARPLRAPEMPAALRAIAPDVAVVACYSQRIPRAVLEIPRFGFVNIHPSLLPAYRGPAPLFWQFRDGVNPFGVTIHFMDELFDSGDIAAQAEVEIPNGATGPEADRLLALAGTALLGKVLVELAAGTLQRYPQKGPDSHAPRPSISDFQIPVTWTAGHAFNFIRGTQEWGQPYRMQTAGGPLIINEAHAFDEDGRLDAPFRIEGEQLQVRFSRGVLQATGHREVLP